MPYPGAIRIGCTPRERSNVKRTAQARGSNAVRLMGAEAHHIWGNHIYTW
jgi:hypothetical protein